MTHLYKIGYGSCEESEFAEMEHYEKFSEEELNTLVIRAIARALQGALDGKYRPFLHGEGPSYSDIHEHVIEELKNDGFVPVKYVGEWSCFGWPSLTDKTSWESQRGRELDEIYNKLQPELISAINERVRINNEKKRRRNLRSYTNLD